MIEWPARCLLHIRGGAREPHGLARSQLDNVGRRCRCGKRRQFAPSIYDWWGQWFWWQMILRLLRLRVTALFADAMQPLDECHFDLRWGRRWREFGDRFGDIKQRTRINGPASNKALEQYFVFEL